MRISAQVSVYPLRERRLSVAIEAFAEALREPGDLDVSVGAMSTVLSGESPRVFEALREAYERIAADHQVVLVLTLSNACPVGPREV
jgi:uncharacterized protein YqgV (UPF0045/DUF77 family)